MISKFGEQIIDIKFITPKVSHISVFVYSAFSKRLNI